MKKNKLLYVILICLLILIVFPGSHAQTVSLDEISITIPRSVIINFIRAALPLNLENGPLAVSPRFHDHTAEPARGKSDLE